MIQSFCDMYAKTRPHSVIAATLVLDTPELVALYWAAGNPYKAPGADRNQSRAIYQAGGKFELVDTVWKYTDVLCLVKPGDSHAVWMYWKQGEQEIGGWYINLQAPLARNALGVDTDDWTLDIVVGADLSEWWWKDEEEFEQEVEAGRFSPERAASIRGEGNRVIEAIRERRAPFDNT